MSEQVQTQRSSVGLFFTSLFLLLILSAIGGVAGWFGATTQTAYWKAEAQFEVPKVTDLGNYYSLHNTYNLLKNDLATNDLAIINSAYKEFTRNVKSPDILQHFLVQNEIVKQLAAKQNKPVSLEAQQLASSFHFNEATNTLSTTLINPNEAVTLLTDFIAFSTLQTRADLNTELITKWKVLFQQVKQLAETSTGTAQQEWTTKLNLMRSVQPLDNQLTAYRLVKSPTVPTKPEAPKDQLLWAAIGGGIGLLLGFFVVLFINRKKN
ncbi:hypothetical protein [Glaesserella parasuis]|uniref:hypothetical protein n=1 Tax=Glaesserella parasuis TaxID=738 RepID=UPI00135D9712|nr:hypothetical protein [Glaesserella parasuis]MDG6791753.1 hypothetical protein [Glaesserella parasuis]MDO9657080.1 hypothetical protein [Glaesserella parasuis]MDO9659428.1 hypothetical protein [Glaesserella parasuis]MDO9668269.1 hypothetical protein [Glaesserella parasuis]MDO9739729.1 hypothetical protein [Glaesserella parasuis]